MVPRTYPSSVDPISGHTQMVAYMLPSVSGLTKWIDYIPVRKGNEQVVGGSYGSYIFVDAKMSQPSGKAWIDYIPVYEDGSATDAWMINSQGYIPYGSASIAAAIQAVRRNGGTALYVPDDYGLALGPELNTTGTAGWTTYSASQSIAGDTITVTSSGGFGGIYKNFPTEIGKRYLVVSASSNGTSNSATIKASGASLANTTTGLQTLRPSFAATVTSTPINLELGSTMGVGTFTAPSVREIISATSFIDSTGTQPVTAINDLVGLLTDRSYGAGNLGGELSPGFSSATGWALGAGSAITDGKLVCTAMGTGVNAIYPIGSQQGKSYAVTYTIDTLTAGSIKLIASSGVSGQTRTTTGTFTELIVPTGTAGNIGFQPVATFTGSIASFSVREVLVNHASQPTTASKPLVTRVPKRLGPNLVSNGGFDSATGWTFSGGSIASGVATWAGASADLQQPITVTVGRDYVITFSVTAYTAGSGVGIHNGVGPFIRGSLTRRNAVGTYTETLTATQTGSLTLNGAFLAAQGASIDNITVQEVLEWTPALDFDGSNDLLTLSSGAILQQGSDHFVTAAFVLDAVGVSSYIYSATSTASGTPFVAAIGTNSADNRLYAQWRDDAGVLLSLISPSAFSSGVPYVITCSKVGSTYSMWINGVLAQSNTATFGATTLNTANIGALVRNTTTGYLNGKLIDIAISQSTLTEADRKTIERNMAQRAGVTYAG